jgi:hypothetical protein
MFNESRNHLQNILRQFIKIVNTLKNQRILRTRDIRSTNHQRNVRHTNLNLNLVTSAKN